MQKLYRIGWSRIQDTDCCVLAETREEAWKKFHDGDLESELWSGSSYDTDTEVIGVTLWDVDDDEDTEHEDCGPEVRGEE